MNLHEPSYRFDAHLGADCVVRYIYTAGDRRDRAVASLVWGEPQFSVVVKWKEGGQSMYLERLRNLMYRDQS